MMRMKAPKEGCCDPIAPLELPHSLHAFHRVSATDEMSKVKKYYLLSCAINNLLWQLARK